MPRTQDDIVAHLKDAQGIDAAWIWEVLALTLDREHAGLYLGRDIADDIDLDDPLNPEAARIVAVDYLRFAFDKARDHRGLSAARSVVKMRAWLWFLELDVDRFDAAPYPQYGVPKLVVAADLLEAGVPDAEALARMAQGLPCYHACLSGCGT